MKNLHIIPEIAGLSVRRERTAVTFMLHLPMQAIVARNATFRRHVELWSLLAFAAACAEEKRQRNERRQRRRKGDTCKVRFRGRKPSPWEQPKDIDAGNHKCHR